MKPRHAPVLILLACAGCADEAATAIVSARTPAIKELGEVPASEVAVWKKIDVAKSPSSRANAAAAFNPSTGKTYVYGGNDVTAWSNLLTDMWAWDGKTWTELTSPMTPPLRESSAMAYDPARGSLILYGGEFPSSSLDPFLDDTWEWTDTGKWTQLAPTTTPGGISAHSMVTDTARDKILLFGGLCTSYEPWSYTAIWNNIWEWDGVALTWTKRTPMVSFQVPTRTTRPTITYDEARKKMFFFEGLGLWVDTSAYWEWNPISAGWSKRSSPPNDALETEVIAYDSVRRRHVLLMQDWLNSIDATWEVDSVAPTWYSRTLAPTPQRKEEAAMVFDSKRNVMVLFGRGPETWEYTVTGLGNGEGCTAATTSACASGNCVDGVCCAAAACTGTCMACNVPGAEGTCTLSRPGTEVAGSCATGKACDGSGGCKNRNGQACTSAGTCASGFCADGVCCDGACTGTCVACNLKGQEGTCSPHPSGSDPGSECGKGVGVCKSTCDGAGSCGYPSETTKCDTCLTCDGFGTCTWYDRSCNAELPEDDVPCYVDSVNGDDGKSGLAESEAVKSQAKIGSTCTIVRFKRGSTYGEKLRIMSQVKTYGNYGDAQDPLPKFVVPRTKSSGPVIQAMGRKLVTFDGLSLSGATGDGTAAGLTQGACVALTYLSTLKNSELADCDVGVILYDWGNSVQGNSIHDMTMGVGMAAGLDPYLLGGGVGILVKGGNTMVEGNTIVNCKGTVQTPGGTSGCYGGAVAFTVPRGGSVNYLTVNRNYSHGNCGFATIGAYLGDAGKGTLYGLQYNYNISVDSGWMALFEVGSTDLSGVTFLNNTFVQHKGSTNSGVLAAMYAAPPAGASGGALTSGAVSLINNYFVVEGLPALDGLLDPSFFQKTNLVLDMATQDPGFVNMRGTKAADYDLVAGSPAIDAGTFSYLGDTNWRDFFGRVVKPKTDVGACECISCPGATGGSTSTPSGGAGGSTAVVSAAGGMGGSTAVVSGSGGAGGMMATGGSGGGAAGATASLGGGAGGGAGGAGGSASGGAGGSTAVVSASGGASGTSSVVSAAGGASGAGGSTSTAATVVGAGGARAVSSGGTSGGRGGSSGTSRPVLASHKGCSCRLGHQPGGGALQWTGLLGVAILMLRRRRGRHA
jgi:hypothetical protein